VKREGESFFTMLRPVPFLQAFTMIVPVMCGCSEQ